MLPPLACAIIGTQQRSMTALCRTKTEISLHILFTFLILHGCIWSTSWPVSLLSDGNGDAVVYGHVFLKPEISRELAAVCNLTVSPEHLSDSVNMRLFQSY
jgi:hypothetical protein